MRKTFRTDMERLRDQYREEAARLAEDSDLPCIYTEYDKTEAKAAAFDLVLHYMDAWKDQPMQYLLIDEGAIAATQITVHPTLDEAREEMKERMKEMIPWMPEELLKVAAYRDQKCAWDLSGGTVWTEDGTVARHWQILCQKWDGTIQSRMGRNHSI